ncbi:signal peptide peptidase SppA [candidate division WOR-3 bacterium]|nr:signal peptide peptidase SppA [candidate division WOR-3 bacterium]
MRKNIYIIIGVVIFIILLLAIFSVSITSRFLTRGNIALIEIEGEILESKKIIKNLEKVKESPFVKGVVIRLNTPGGTVTPFQEIVREIDILQDKGKIVVASLGNIAASGGYYIACTADRIVANPGTITGSISVKMTFPYIEELAKKIGFDIMVIKSREYKDIGSPFKRMSEKEKALLQEVVDDVYIQFVDEVVKGRGIDKDSILKIADGRIFSGKMAKELGLVDTLGTLNDAIAIAGELAGIKGKPNVITYKERKTPALFRLFSSIDDKMGVSLQYIYNP